MKAKFWIAVVSKNHVLNGIRMGIMQVCHGKKAPLQRIHKNDYIIFYSSKIQMRDRQVFQKFTAIAKAIDDEIYQVQQFENFEPFRRKVTFLECKEAAIKPMLASLDFIENKQRWGYPFRYGLVEISEKDFRFITTKMALNYD